MTKFGIQIIKSDDDTFIDNLTCKTDYEIPQYFRITYNENSEILGTPNKFEDLFIQIENSETSEETNKLEESKTEIENSELSGITNKLKDTLNDNENNEISETESQISGKEENNGLSTGAIIAITLAGVAVISSSVILIIYIIKKKKNITETIIQFNNAELEQKE